MVILLCSWTTKHINLYKLGSVLSDIQLSIAIVMEALFVQVLAAISTFLVIAVTMRLRAPGRIKYPPGPPAWPLIGSMFNNPATYPLAYKNWRAVYGPISYFRLLTQDVIVLNTREAANELLEKQSASYSDRPRQVMCGELMSWNRGIALCPAGARHRAYRKLVNSVLSADATKRAWSSHERAACAFVADLLLFSSYAASESTHPEASSESVKGRTSSGSEFISRLRHSIGTHAVEIIYGSEYTAEDGIEIEGGRGHLGMSARDAEDYIQNADEQHTLFTAAVLPFAYIVDWIPWLRYIPEATPFVHFKKIARQARRNLEALTWEPYLKARERIKCGCLQNSLVDVCFKSNPDPSPQEEECTAWAAMGAYTAGSDTTIAALTTVFLAASLNPEAQALAQLELDTIVGRERMPRLDDRPALPYVTAFVRECMRSVPSVPLGVPHRALNDDVLYGYFIPKGATVIANIRGMLHDPEVYSSPFTFNPARFLPRAGISTLPGIEGRAEPDLGSLPYGFGRRICPGMHMADSEVWIYTAMFLWAFNIKKSGADVSTGANHTVTQQPENWQSIKLSEGGIQCPIPFGVELAVRSEELKAVIQAEAV
ncbi:cytochrome P450 [Hygrophoropsis aurantiaca]|uniref:Cytochrome P450 n=1 Tax=Hygrophoropsis aurantiaca TaxID=72124 RepID=A0ACB8A5M4_9AGAM|nr:cytochrome P450 [Hygrophoropsis aurantiaca]